MSSALYEGTVAHHRRGGVEHGFSYKVALPLLDLGEMPRLLDRVPLWSARRPAPARFREADHLPGGDGPLAERARRLCRDRIGHAPEGPVRLLANPRYLGVGFNPISLLFLFGADGCTVEAVIAEVTNTPWRERTAYVLDARGRRPGEPARATFDKAMHVSPFQPMDQRYEIAVSDPADGLRVRVANLEGGREVFTATLALRRRDLTPARLTGLLLRHPPATLATLLRIYANALRLKLKGARYHPHPRAAG